MTKPEPPVAPDDTPTRLPKRDVPELIDALRVRAASLCGEAWERTATRDMMNEAADNLAELRAEVSRLREDWQKIHDATAGKRDVPFGVPDLCALAEAQRSDSLSVDDFEASKERAEAEVSHLREALTEALKWKDSIIDACVVDWILIKEHENDPIRAVNDLLCWQQKIALDPAISKDAHDLVQRAELAEAEVSSLQQVEAKQDREIELANEAREKAEQMVSRLQQENALLRRSLEMLTKQIDQDR